MLFRRYIPIVIIQNTYQNRTTYSKIDQIAKVNLIKEARARANKWGTTCANLKATSCYDETLSASVYTHWNNQTGPSQANSSDEPSDNQNGLKQNTVASQIAGEDDEVACCIWSRVEDQTHSPPKFSGRPTSYDSSCKRTH